jgi:hypothetical protein
MSDTKTNISFRFYITNLHAGEISGTNDEDKAEAYSMSEDHFVVDTHTNYWLRANGKEIVKEIK